MLPKEPLKPIDFQSKWLFAPLSIPVLILLSAILSLTSLLNSGFSGDDAMNSVISAHLALDHTSLFGFIIKNALKWLELQGRFFPLSSYIYIVFNYIHSVLIYKVICLSVICLNIFTFGYLVRITTKSKTTAYLFMLLIPLLFQFRMAHDPILSFCFLLPLLLLETTLALIYFYKYLTLNSKRYLLLSGMCYGASLLTYEITYSFFILFYILAYHIKKDIKKAAVSALPFLAGAASMVAVSLYLRSDISTLSSGYAIHFSFIKYSVALLKQVTAALPLANPSRIVSHGAFFKNLAIWSCQFSGCKFGSMGVVLN